MKVSIVTISFNQSKYIEKAILSIIGQKDIDLEYIVVDPGSTDGSRNIIEKYRNSISKIIYEKDKGPADGLNKGFIQSHGDILGFINSDDMLMPNSLEKVINFFKNYSKTDVLLGRGYIINEDDKLIRYIIPNEFSVRKFVTGGFQFIQQSMFFRKSAFENCGGFNIYNKTCWDGELLLDMGISGCNIVCSGDELGLFRIHENSITSTGRLNEQYLLDRNRLFTKAMGRNREIKDYIYEYFYRIKKLILDK
ncbi:WcaA Glycosyltransferases involved in cell wall biogenesis [Burkholderiaceae bacterium]